VNHWMSRRKLLLAATSLPIAGMASAEPLQRGQLVNWPGVSLLDGSRIETEHVRGRPAVVVFWSLHCAFCERHNAHIEALHRVSAKQGLLVLGVVAEAQPRQLLSHMAARNWTFPVTLDRSTLAAALGARRSVPFTVTITRDGRLAEQIPGEMFEADVLGFRSLLSA